MQNFMQKSIIYSNNPDYLWDRYAEQAVETLQSEGVSNPSDYQIWDLIDFWDFTVWDSLNDQISEFFKISDIWIGKCCPTTKSGRDLGEKGMFHFFDWEEFKYKALKYCEEFKIYDSNGHLFIETINLNSEKTCRLLHELRPCSELGVIKIKVDIAEEREKRYGLVFDNFCVAPFLDDYLHGQKKHLALAKGDDNDTENEE